MKKLYCFILIITISIVLRGDETVANSSAGQVINRIPTFNGRTISVPGLTLTNPDQSGVVGSTGFAVPFDNNHWLFPLEAGSVFITSKTGCIHHHIELIF